MSYASAVALQTAVFQRLSEDVGLAAHVGSAIYDEAPSGSLPETYVTLGPETVTDKSDATGGGALHKMVISVISGAAGFGAAKAAAVAIGDALADHQLPLSRGRLVSLRFERAQAKREDSGSLRRIDLRFVARVDTE